MKKILLKIPLYYLLFVLLCLTERTVGIYGVAAALSFSVLYCREKPYAYLPSLIGATLTVVRTVPVYVFVAVVVAVHLVSFFLHRKKKWKFSTLEIILYSLVCLAPRIAFGPFTPLSIAAAVLSAIASVAACYVGVVALFPFLVRGIKYPRNGNENVCLGILTIALSIGIAEFTPFSVNVICLLISLFLSPLCVFGSTYVVPFALCVGVGAAIGLYDPSVALYFAAPALVVAIFSKKPAPIRCVVSVAVFFFVTSFFFGKVDLYSLIPYAVGSTITAFLPDKLLRRFSPDKDQTRYALRTIVNRDRESLAAKLLGVSEAFSSIKDAIAAEQPPERSPETVIRAVCEKTCVVCPHFRKCVQNIGDIAVPVRKLVHTALSDGKVSLLDADASLGKHCQKLPYLLRSVNEESDAYRAELRRRSDIEQSKDAVLSDLNGIADVLKKLSGSVDVNLSFDADTEKKLLERLSKSNIICKDACIYSDGKEKEVTVIVREKDADKPSLSEIVSSTVGYPLIEYLRKKEINGDVSLHFCRAPSYKVLYGESFSARENHCGDTRQAVKIDNHRSLFLLSDGMGTGESAKSAAVRVSELLIRFYKAGFSHETVFANVSHLLSLRSGEDFSALDAVVVDARTAEVDFIKQGGRESYLFSDKQYEVIEGDTLPIGIVETVPKTVRKKLRPDDMIVLLSDGVADALTPNEVAQIVASTPGKNPKSISDALLENAVRLTKKPDDMTVICMRLVRA